MFIGLYFYLLIGVIFGWHIDRLEIKKDVPYPEMPSVTPLQTIRTIVYIACALAWLPIFIFAIIKIIRHPDEVTAWVDADEAQK